MARKTAGNTTARRKSAQTAQNPRGPRKPAHKKPTSKKKDAAKARQSAAGREPAGRRKTSAAGKATASRKDSAAHRAVGMSDAARSKSVRSKAAGSKSAVPELVARQVAVGRVVKHQAAAEKTAERKPTDRKSVERKATEPQTSRGKPTPRKAAQPSVGERRAASAMPPAPPKRTAAPLDFSKFPPESLTHAERWICLACVWEVFTRHMGLAPRTALLEIKRYTPSLEELGAQMAARPYFIPGEAKSPCPYCGSSSKWHARMASHRIESGKATDVLRRELLKSLAKSADQFAVLEQKSTQQEAFFDWLEKISKQLDLDNPGWLREVSLHYLSRKEPKVDWNAEFQRIHSIRRSRRLEEGWEVDGRRLFLSPPLFDELLLVQYLLSRSHRAGGLTLERRYTLPELWHRLRNSGYLRTVGVTAGNPSDALEQLLGYLGGGDASVRFYYIVDRRAFLETAKLLSAAKSKR